MVRQIILAGFAVILPAGAQAQVRGMVAPASHGFGAGPRVVMQAQRVGTAQAMSGTRVAARGGVVRARTATPSTRSTRQQGTTTRRRFEDENNRARPNCNSAPGLGFDAAHLAAICGPTTFGSRTNDFGFPFFLPFFDSGFSQPGSSATVDEGSAAENSQPEATDAEVRERSRRNRGAEPATELASDSAAPADNEQYVFVRRDGTVFFAVAYAWERGTLRYITSQGLRRSVTQDALDLDATKQFNEQRGLNFRLPA